jgi:hypothetical protein
VSKKSKEPATDTPAADDKRDRTKEPARGTQPAAQSTATLAGELISRCEQERNAAQADAQALRKRIGEQDAVIAQLRTVLATSESVRLALAAHVQELLAARDAAIFAQPVSTALSDRNDSYDRFLASSGGAPEGEIHPEESGSIEYDRASADADGDCPI